MRIDRVKLVAELARQDMTQKQLAERAGIAEFRGASAGSPYISKNGVKSTFCGFGIRGNLVKS